PNRIGEIDESDLPTDPTPPRAQQRNQERELDSRDEGRWKDDQQGDDRPASHKARESPESERAQEKREKSDAVSQCEWKRDEEGLQKASPGKDAQGRPALFGNSVKKASCPDAEQGDR